MNLKFVEAIKPGPASPTVQRRQRLARRIDQQIGLLTIMKDGGTARAPWVWMDETGSHFVPIKYGRQQIELKKGMFSIQCKDLDECEQAFKAVRAMVVSGELDDQLAKASADIRRRFSG